MKRRSTVGGPGLPISSAQGLRTPAPLAKAGGDRRPKPGDVCGCDPGVKRTEGSG